MFHSIQVSGYRGLSSYEVRELGRVNLLVGRNNSGKTSVLEAGYVLGSGGDPAALWRICNRRGERFAGEPSRYPRRSEVDVSHLFTGHELTIGQSFSIEGNNRSKRQLVNVAIDDFSERESEDEPDLIRDEETLTRRRMALRIRSPGLRRQQIIPLSRQGGLGQENAELASSPPGRLNRERAANVHFISTESLSGNELIRHWDRIQLTPDEALVLQALRFVDPSIEQIRSFGTGSAYGPRGGFLVKRKQEPLPFPLGSLGDGAWRMLTLAIILTQCAGGMLFIDEIDTGLHYTVLAEMWHLIHAASRQFDVQVFASTHSYDCVHSLSTICRADESAGSEVTIQRIESDKPVATPFTEIEIRTAAERQIEIR
ncbi:MAG TPA: AAA family ATPase [Acetobacteraceae bacterium]|nr:AAA family ATPase [Acetobacteraceae bacterium]